MAASLPQLNKVVPHPCLFAEGAEILRGISDGGDDLAATLMSCQRGRELPYGQGGHFSGKDSIGPEDYRRYDQAKQTSHVVQTRSSSTIAESSHANRILHTPPP